LRDEGIQRGIVTFDSLETGLREIDGRGAFAPKQLRGFLDGQACQVLRISAGRRYRPTGSRGSAGGKEASGGVNGWLRGFVHIR
jgi:hypothetical protein